MKLTNDQRAIINAPLDAKIFLAGPASCGKTTAGVNRLQSMLASGIPADAILVITPQRTLQLPYETILRGPEIGPGGMVTLATVGGLARRMCDLFWPLAAETAGFAHPDQPPIFLTLETAQYYMARIVRPLLEEGFFESVTIDHNRLYSQILDNLNKSASVGFPYTEIGPRLDTAWYGEPAQRRVYANVQECATRFRQYCHDHNLLDFSLQLDIFWNILWHTPECHNYLTHHYRHLIYDNAEEDIPVAHDLFCEWLPDLNSALIIFDEDAGYRRFLGADPESALRLADLCDSQAELRDTFVVSPEIQALSDAFTANLSPSSTPAPIDGDTLSALTLPPAETPTRFYPQMLDWVADEIHRLVAEENVALSEIVVLAPYLSDALRFSLSNRLEEHGISWRSHRPSRSLRDEPATHCLLTLAELAHPGWDIHPTKFDVAYALLYAIESMDLVRAQLLTDIVYRVRDFRLSTFGEIRTEVQERITFVFGERYEILREWIEAYRQQAVPDPLDHFLRRLFGEVLSQRGFGFHRNPDGARTTANLIESIQKFRVAMEPAMADFRNLRDFGSLEIGKEYIAMLQDGVIAAQYVEGWQMVETEAVLIAPAHTFLMMNRPARIQFWLDAGASGWWERLFQPLTQPYILARAWIQQDPGRVWTDADEVKANQDTLVRLVTGLLRRCRDRVYLGLSDLGESGFEQRGPLLKAIWKMQMQATKDE